MYMVFTTRGGYRSQWPSVTYADFSNSEVGVYGGDNIVFVYSLRARWRLINKDHANLKRELAQIIAANDKRAVSEREIALLDWKNLKSQKRVFDLPAITRKVASSPRDEDLGVLGHASILCNAQVAPNFQSRRAVRESMENFWWSSRHFALHPFLIGSDPICQVGTPTLS